MFKFKKFCFDPENFDQKAILEYLEVAQLVTLYKTHIFDDFVQKSTYETIVGICKRYFPYFWLILRDETDEVAGFAYLYDVVGDKKSLHSACVTTCFKKSFWGAPARRAAKIFLKFCFGWLGLKKLRAECFASNRLVTGFLRDLNFKKEGILKNETIVNKKPEDLVVWGLLGENN